MSITAAPVYHRLSGSPALRLWALSAGQSAPLRYVPGVAGDGKRGRLHRGFGLLDVALSIAVGALSIAGFLQFEADTSNKLKASGAADFMTQVSAAATTYLQTNYTTLQQNLSGGGQAVVPVSGASTIFGLPSLQASGLLPSSFNNVNGYGQSAVLIVRDVPANGNTPEHIEGLVSTYGGTKMADGPLGVAVSKMGGMGGAVFSRPVPGTPAATVSGSGGSWSSPISNWSANAAYAPSAGHLAANIQQQSAMSAPWLNRYNTGNPDDNRMHTDIDDNNNNINNVTNLDTKTISNSRGNSVGVNSQLIIQNGGEACAGNQTGCSWLISDDGGFYDQNDGWITFKGNSPSGYGLKLAGVGNSLQVGGTTESIGQIYADQGVTLYGSSPVLWGSYGGGLRMQDDQWLQAYGGDGFQGISTNIVKAAMLQDANDPSYYVQPSQTSYMNQLVMNNGTAQYFSVTQLLGAQNIAFAHSLFSVYPNTGNLSVNIDGQTGNAQFGGYVTVGGDLSNWSNTSPIVLRPDGDSKFGGTMTIGQQINLPATATADAACSPNGAIAANATGNGQAMSCFNGQWRAVGEEAVETTYTLPDTPGIYNGDQSAMNLGEHYFCALAGTFEMNDTDPNSAPNATRVLPSDPDPATGLRTWYLSRGNLGGLGGSASCIDFK